MSLSIDNNRVVSLNYKLTDNDGNVLDSSEGSEPMVYLHGADNMIPGLEKALVGKVVGDSLQVRIEPDEGYGEFNPDLVQTVERSVFQDMDSIEVGMTFDVEAPDGSVQPIVVRKVEGDEITIDVNHPLAGVVLIFDVEIVGVREATKEERYRPDRETDSAHKS